MGRKRGTELAPDALITWFNRLPGRSSREVEELLVVERLSGGHLTEAGGGPKTRE